MHNNVCRGTEQQEPQIKMVLEQQASLKDYHCTSTYFHRLNCIAGANNLYVNLAGPFHPMALLSNKGRLLDKAIMP